MKKIFTALAVVVAGIALSACSNCGPCKAVYQKPCCARGAAAPAAPAPAPAPAPQQPAGGSMACGAGKCG